MSEQISGSPAPVDNDLAPGDVLRSEYGRTIRTVVAVDGDDVILRTPKGAIDAISLSAARRFWRKISSNEA